LPDRTSRWLGALYGKKPQTPKVAKELRQQVANDPTLALLFPRALAPFRESFDSPEEYQAEPEVHNDSQVEAGGIMPGGSREIGHEQKINDVPRDDGDEGLEEIHACTL
jgi:hypothetical protein